MFRILIHVFSDFPPIPCFPVPFWAPRAGTARPQSSEASSYIANMVSADLATKATPQLMAESDKVFNQIYPGKVLRDVSWYNTTLGFKGPSCFYDDSWRFFSKNPFLVRSFQGCFWDSWVSDMMIHLTTHKSSGCSSLFTGRSPCLLLKALIVCCQISIKRAQVSLD